MEHRPGEKIAGSAEIPEEDREKWTETLREGGLTDQEIAEIVGALTSEKAKDERGRRIDEAVVGIIAKSLQRGKILTPKEIQELKRTLESEMK